MNCGDWVRVGYITRIKDEIAEVNIQGEVVNANIIYPFGYYGNIPITANSLCILLAPNNNNNNYFCIPFNLSIYPYLASGEIIIQNTNASVSFSPSGGITINATENITVNSVNTTITATGQVDITAPTINLADATANVLNANAVINDSLGNPCTITNAGQVKVKA
jgi:hypothetical protein